MSEAWGRFARDPRAPEHAELRAGHADREIVLEVLGEAYADGRLDADEFEHRADAAQTARTLGELPELLADLVPDRGLGSGVSSRVPATTDAIQRRAVEKWEAKRRDAVWSFITPSAVCWLIWAIVMPLGFPWPLFVMLGTGLNLVATQFRRPDIIAEEVRRLERRAEKERAKALEKERHRELDAGFPDPEPPSEAD